MKLEDHPTVQRIRLKTVPSVPPKQEPLDAGMAEATGPRLRGR